VQIAPAERDDKHGAAREPDQWDAAAIIRRDA
jgi:hypothetical protein